MPETTQNNADSGTGRTGGARWQRDNHGQQATLVLEGSWVINAPNPTRSELLDTLGAPEPGRIVVNGRHLENWDTSLVAMVFSLRNHFTGQNTTFDVEEFPDGAQRLLKMASAAAEQTDAGRSTEYGTWIDEIGQATIRGVREAWSLLDFIGEAAISLTRVLTGRGQCRLSDFVRTIHDCGPSSLPIITLIAFLMGLILAFVGAVQLRMFGAEIYVADLVGIGIVREMGAIMTGVVMAGRTGAAFAARLGSMQVNEEIDALKTMGISPVDFLVIPRMLGLTVMMPLLCLYANAMGILGGLLVATIMLDINIWQYLVQTREAVGMNDLWVGLVMSFTFGILVSLAGCLRGMQCGRSSAAVGQATTSAVVTSIVSIVVATATITVICDIIGV